MPGKGVECMAVGGLEGASLVRTRGAGEDVVRHAHRSLIISAVLSGERVVTAHGRSVALVPGSVLVVQPGMVHSCRSSALHSLTLCLPASLLSEGAALPGLAVYHDDTLAALVAGAWNRLAVSVNNAGADHAETKVAEARSLLTAVFRANPGQSVCEPEAAASPAVRRARAGLDTRPDMDGAELAGVAGMSTWGLNRAFARAYGLPPHSYSLLRRVNRAKELLALGAAPAQVAAETGFADQSHFTKKFRRLVGLTPARYARAFAHRRGERT